MVFLQKTYKSGLISHILTQYRTNIESINLLYLAKTFPSSNYVLCMQVFTFHQIGNKQNTMLWFVFNNTGYFTTLPGSQLHLQQMSLCYFMFTS